MKVNSNFKTRIKLDKQLILTNPASGSTVTAKLQQIDGIFDEKLDELTKLKLAGKLLLDVTSELPVVPEVKKSAKVILNSFFDAAKQADDQELIQISKMISERWKPET
ncbi:MAG TPA: hypothetical protein PLX35_16445 [Cyclobacteriaceae bacterium]|nr:hypothetical protein [Cyclobacteriaceae bacterium]